MESWYIHKVEQRSTNSFNMCQFACISSTKCQQLYLTYERKYNDIAAVYLCW